LEFNRFGAELSVSVTRVRVLSGCEVPNSSARHIAKSALVAASDQDRYDQAFVDAVSYDGDDDT
jgi:hypothetical protein